MRTSLFLPKTSTSLPDTHPSHPSPTRTSNSNGEKVTFILVEKESTELEESKDLSKEKFKKAASDNKIPKVVKQAIYPQNNPEPSFSYTVRKGLLNPDDLDVLKLCLHLEKRTATLNVLKTKAANALETGNSEDDFIVEKYIPSFSRFRSLNLSNATFRELPKFIINFKNLQALNLANNNLENLTHLNKLTNLKHLILSKNNLTKLSDLKLPNLVILDLSNNPLSHISKKFLLNLPKLETLQLRNNNIQSKKFSSLVEFKNQSIKNLNLTGNKIKEIPKAFFQFENLQTLDLTDNCLENFEHLNKMENLKKLILNNNNIKELPDLKLPNLVTLDISNNPLSGYYTSGTFLLDCPKLEKIYISTAQKSCISSYLLGQKKFILTDNDFTDTNFYNDSSSTEEMSTEEPTEEISTEESTEKISTEESIEESIENSYDTDSMSNWQQTELADAFNFFNPFPKGKLSIKPDHKLEDLSVEEMDESL